MPNLYDWKPVTVPVTVHLTDEAAKILFDYAGERGRGRFLSALLVAQRRQDDLEGERIAAEVARAAARQAAAAAAAEAAPRDREQPAVAAPRRISRKVKRGRK